MIESSLIFGLYHFTLSSATQSLQLIFLTTPVVKFDLCAYTTLRPHHLHTSHMQVFTLCGRHQNMMGV